MATTTSNELIKTTSKTTTTPVTKTATTITTATITTTNAVNTERSDDLEDCISSEMVHGGLSELPDDSLTVQTCSTIDTSEFLPSSEFLSSSDFFPHGVVPDPTWVGD